MAPVKMSNHDHDNWIILGFKEFKLFDQVSFARISGDKNPIHLSEEFARKTPPGQPIVHGINAVLWSLELFVNRWPKLKSQISVRFLNSIYLNEIVCCRINKQSSILEIFSNDIIHIRITLDGDIFHGSNAYDFNGHTDIMTISEMTIEDIEDQQLFKFQHAVNLEDIANNYPNLSKFLGRAVVGQFVSLSAVVGMIVPGLHSIFSSLKVHLQHNNDTYIKVLKVDKRFSVIDIGVGTGNLSGVLRAIVRPAPVIVRSFSNVLPYVPSRKFAKRTALVIGGTRGLGALTTKLLVAGGAEVAFTYANGIKEAETLKEEIGATGHSVSYFKFDVNQPDYNALFSKLNDVIFYFSTPKIFTKRSKSFENSMYLNFYKFFVSVPECILIEAEVRGVTGVFIPSSTALVDDQANTPEYSLAKQESENMLHAFADRGILKCFSPRLPRLLTDQTATNLSIPAFDPIEKMLPLILNFMTVTGSINE
jgi:hypothetical protein